MGQVPRQKYGIIGSGRAANHLAAYFRTKQIPYLKWSRRSQKSDPAETSLEKCVADSEILFILINDRAIEAFIESTLQAMPEFRDKTLIHFSGSLVTTLAHGMHPLMTFTDSPYSLNTYEKIPFICDENGPEFHTVFPGFLNPHFKIHPENKALYHALCVMSGNFTTLLWQTFFARLEVDLGLPSEIAKPYLEQITFNLLQAPHAALSGPIARGDLETIEKNLKALEGDSLHAIYSAFVSKFLPEPPQPPQPKDSERNL